MIDVLTSYRFIWEPVGNLSCNGYVSLGNRRTELVVPCGKRTLRFKAFQTNAKRKQLSFFAWRWTAKQIVDRSSWIVMKRKALNRTRFVFHWSHKLKLSLQALEDVKLIENKTQNFYWVLWFTLTNRSPPSVCTLRHYMSWCLDFVRNMLQGTAMIYDSCVFITPIPIHFYCWKVEIFPLSHCFIHYDSWHHRHCVCH